MKKQIVLISATIGLLMTGCGNSPQPNPKVAYWKTLDTKSEIEQLQAIEQSQGFAFHFIHNPSRQVRLTALKVDCGNIEWITVPTSEEQLLAVTDQEHQLCNYYIQHMKNPSFEVQLKAVQEDPRNIKWIKNPSEKLQIIALSGFKQTKINISRGVLAPKEILKLIKNPSFKIYQIAEKLQAEWSANQHM